ncbi:eCIS core domain-containing protein, partial [Streptomyces zhihengii]
PRAGGAATGAVPPEAASEVAEHERGPQFQAAFGEGRKQMSEGRQKKDTDFRTSQEKHRQKVDAEVASNTAGQAAERDRAMADVTAQRAGWRAEQDEELGKLGDKKTERHEKVRKDVQDKEKQTDDDVAKEKDDGDRKIRDENTRAERDAEKKRDDSVEDSGNWVTKAFDWIKKKVIEIKDAIVRVIKAARDAVVGFIKNFKETVERWIDAARKFVVDTIKQLVDDLVEFAKAMVRAIVELAARVRKFVTDLIAAAIALVNRLADALKQAVSDLLDAIGKLLSSILDFLKKMLQAAVKAVVDAVKAVLDFASKLLSALGDWMLIAVDFLSDPGGWLGGAKNSAVDGAKNHLFAEVSSAVKQWFREKIQEIIGVPKAVIDKLVRGGWTLDKIVKEAWDAVVPQLPLIIGELVMTKVVAKLIPGAGWVMAVIDAIRTAWGALSAILRALGMVLDWLKAVRGGGAGILFAKAVAAGVVALLEVLYQALLSGIGKYVSKVGRRLKDVAAKLGKPKDSPTKSPAPPGDTPGKPKPRPTQAPPKPQSAPAPKRPTTPSRPDRTTPPGRPDTAPAPRPKPHDPSPAAKPQAPRPDRPDRPRDTAERPDRPRDTAR